MSRFENLEISGESEDQPRRQKSFVKDELFYLAEAQASFENGNFEAALRSYGKVIEFNARNPSAWSGQVRMLLELGEFKEAKLWADKALEYFPSDPELLAAKAVTLARNGDLHGALVFSDAAIEVHGDTPYVWLARGDVLLAREEHRADYCFEKALQLAPGNWFVEWLAARVRFFYRQFALAMKLLQQAVERNAGHFALWLELGRCQEALGLEGPARVSYDQARQLNPGCSEARLGFIKLSSPGFMPGWLRRLLNK
jgi:Flp pilus assembly protein TadD